MQGFPSSIWGAGGSLSHGVQMGRQDTWPLSWCSRSCVCSDNPKTGWDERLSRLLEFQSLLLDTSLRLQVEISCTVFTMDVFGWRSGWKSFCVLLIWMWFGKVTLVTTVVCSILPVRNENWLAHCFDLNDFPSRYIWRWHQSCPKYQTWYSYH